jgi:hypothetical protein
MENLGLNLRVQPMDYWKSYVLAGCSRFFYKYDPLSNTFVKNNPLQISLPNMAWREEEKVARVAFRHSAWRIKVLAYQTGGKYIPPLTLAGGWLAMLCSFLSLLISLMSLFAWIRR